MRSNYPPRTLAMMFVEPGKRQVRRPVTQRRRGRMRRALIAAMANGLYLSYPDRRWVFVGASVGLPPGVDWTSDIGKARAYVITVTTGPVYGADGQLVVDDPLAVTP